ncbi:MAG TPA: EipA family protein [Sphingomicrobium sp.]
MQAKIRLGRWAAMLLLMAGPASAQVRTVDPTTAMAQDTGPAPTYLDQAEPTAPPAVEPDRPAPALGDPASTPRADAGPGAKPAVPVSNTYNRDDVLGAAENTFGKGAAGLAQIIEKALGDQGEPNAYIAGSEGAGAVVIGLRYGKGILSHRIEGQKPIYWTGPSVGFDVGGDANKVFTLVYNLYDTQDLYKRFPAAEGRLYFIGGFAASYMRHGNIVLIPIRLGVGYRAGVNVGYMKFSPKSKWFPL